MDNTSFVALILNGSLLAVMVLAYEPIANRWQIRPSLIRSILTGLGIGGIGIAVMFTPWVYIPGIVFDTRSILLGLSGLFFGLIPTSIAMLMSGVFRVIQGGGGMFMGLGVILSTGMMGIAWRHIRHRNLVTLKIFELYIFGLVIHIVMLGMTLLLPGEKILDTLKAISLPVILLYPLGTAFLGNLMVERLKRTKTLDELRLAETRMSSIARILQYSYKTRQEFLDFALDEVIQLTGSKLGYIYYYSEETQQFILNTWSKEVMQACSINEPQTCYELEKTGVWGEAVRQRKPIVLNDYPAAHPLKKGYPEGHAHLQKFLTVPVFSGDNIVAVVGVANKTEDYTQQDVDQLTLMMGEVWKSTEHFRLDEALQTSETNYKLLFEQSADGIFISDLEGNYQDVNKRGCEMLGFSKEELLQMNLKDIVIDEEIPENPIRFKELSEGLKIANQRKLRRKDGSQVEVEINGQKISENRMMGVVRDIGGLIAEEKKLKENRIELQRLLSEAEMSRRALLSVIEDQKIAEEKILKLNQELEDRVRKRTAQLETANKELESFSYSVSHDLRAPLRAIDGFTSILQEEHDQELTPESRRYFNLIRQNAVSMGELVDDLLAFSHLGQQSLNVRLTPPREIVERVIEGLQIEIGSRKVEFVIGDLPECSADPGLLQRVYENLINNAVKFTRRQENAVIEIGSTSCVPPQKKKERQVKSKSDPVTCYYVRDNGTGFDMRFYDKLFGVFNRLHKAEDFEGTGVGLAIVQRVVEKHGGRVWAESELGNGAAFYFTLGGNPDGKP